MISTATGAAKPHPRRETPLARSLDRLLVEAEAAVERRHDGDAADGPSGSTTHSRRTSPWTFARIAAAV